MRLATLWLLLLFGPAVHAQPDRCRPGAATAFLDTASVRAGVGIGGAVAFHVEENAFMDGVYFVPKDGTAASLYALQPWVSGLVDGAVRTAGALYRSGYHPGPLDARTGLPPRPDDCSAYDRIWKVGRADVAHYRATGVATADLREWPAHLGAPVLDGDGIEGNYDLAAGDEPAIEGEQALYWVFNDAVDRGPYYSPPIGLEVRATAFASTLGGTPYIGPLREAIHHTTFYRYEVINRSTSPLDSAYFSTFIDGGPGDVADNYIGSDSLLGLAYIYNADDSDGAPPYGYGAAPPAIGFSLVETPALIGRPERDRFTSVMTTYDDDPYGVQPSSGVPPSADLRWWRGAQCLWGSGQPRTRGGRGRDASGPQTCWSFDGEPQAYWSMGCPTPGCAEPFPNGAWVIPAVGPFRLEPGGHAAFVLAITWARGADHLDSVAELREATLRIRNAYAAGLLDPRPVGTPLAEPPPPEAPGISAPAPNPATARAVWRYEVPEGGARVRLVLYDVLGREVARVLDGPALPGAREAALDTSPLPSGVYLWRFEAGAASRSGKLTVVR